MCSATFLLMFRVVNIWDKSAEVLQEEVSLDYKWYKRDSVTWFFVSSFFFFLSASFTLLSFQCFPTSGVNHILTCYRHVMQTI